MECAGFIGLLIFVLIVLVLYLLDARQRDAYRHRYELWLEHRRQGFPPSGDEERAWQEESERKQKELEDFLRDWPNLRNCLDTPSAPRIEEGSPRNHDTCPVKPPERDAVPTTTPHRSLDELARLAGDVFDRQVRPALRPEDDGKFVAIDVDTGDYEINEGDYAANARLRARKPSADIWLMRTGYPAAFRL